MGAPNIFQSCFFQQKLNLFQIQECFASIFIFSDSDKSESAYTALECMYRVSLNISSRLVARIYVLWLLSTGRQVKVYWEHIFCSLRVEVDRLEMKGENDASE
jgi:hypothetical protein